MNKPMDRWTGRQTDRWIDAERKTDRYLDRS